MVVFLFTSTLKLIYFEEKSVEGNQTDLNKIN